MRFHTIHMIGAGLIFVSSWSIGDELVAPDTVVPVVELDIPRPIYIDQMRKDNCEVWVELRYEGAADIFNQKLKITDSKPASGFEQEATQELLSVLSREKFSRNSRLFTIHHANGKTENIFTYFKGCKGRSHPAPKPNKALNRTPKRYAFWSPSRLRRYGAS